MITRLFLAIVVAFGFATMVFANGGGGGGGDVIYPQDPNFPKDEFMRNCGAKDVKCTGAVYRCFKYLGKSQNTNATNKVIVCQNLVYIVKMVAKTACMNGNITKKNGSGATI